MTIKDRAGSPCGLGFVCLLLPGQRFPLASSDPVDVTLKIAVVDQFRQNVLHKGRDGAGVKTQFSLKTFDQLFGQDHVPDPQGGRDGFGKRVQVNHVVLAGEGKQSFCRLGGK